MAQSLREKYIGYILKHKTGDVAKHGNTTRFFLETLSLDELARLADYQEEFEDEFELDGEIHDIDFDEELY